MEHVSCCVLDQGQEEVIPDQAGSTVVCLEGDSVGGLLPTSNPGIYYILLAQRLQSLGSPIFCQGAGLWKGEKDFPLPPGACSFILYWEPHNLWSCPCLHNLSPYFVYNKVHRLNFIKYEFRRCISVDHNHSRSHLPQNLKRSSVKVKHEMECFKH